MFATEPDRARFLQHVLQHGAEAVPESLDALDADAFLRLCHESDVMPWVDRTLEVEGLRERFPQPVVDGLARRRRKVQHDNLLLLARAEEAFDRLLEAGVVPVALKGTDFIHRLYDRFDERTLDDVDLLVRPDQLLTALGALEAGGWQLPPEPKRTHYIRSSHHLPLRSPGPVTVDFELHWNLAQEDRFRVDVPGLFERSQPIEIAGRSILRLSDTDAVAHLLLHHFTHYFDRRLKWAVDLHLLAEQDGLDWRAVADTCRRWHASTVSGFALLHLRKQVPSWIPDAALEALPASAWRAALTWPLRSSHPMDLFRDTRERRMQLFLAAALLEQPTMLPRWLLHRATRGKRAGSNPLDSDG